MKLSFKTPAKINLGLYILNKRPDGYHELETLLQMVSLFDEIDLETAPTEVKLSCSTPGIPTDASNLVLRAVAVLKEAFPQKSSGVRIHLKKHIPAGAGLGGGSGNAAGVLMALNRLWDLRLTRDQLAPLAAKLGSDVPFFLGGPCALGRGRGEVIEPLEPSEKFSVVLVYPGFPIPTEEVYRELKIKLTNPGNNISILKKFLSDSEIVALGNRLHNDLEVVVERRFPEIETIKGELLAHGAKGALVSGSGSTVFGIFDNPEHAHNACSKMNIGKGLLFLTETITDVSEFLPEEMLNYP